MTTNFKRIITEKVAEAIRSTEINLPLLKEKILSDLKISLTKNNIFELNIPTKSLRSVGIDNHLTPHNITVEPNGVIEKVYSNVNKNIAFSIKREVFIENILTSVWRSKRSFYKNWENNCEKQKILLEYSSPNIAKPFHLGHLRSTIIGNFIANLHEYMGDEVIRINYLGDWGTQFGLLSLGLASAGISEESIEKDPINVLYSVYVKANKMALEDPKVAESARKIFFCLEEGATNFNDRNHKELKQWEKIRGYTEKELKLTYDRLGVKFDVYAWESEYRAHKILPLISRMENEGILEIDNDGKKVVRIGNEKKGVTLVKSDGSTLYLTRDVACALDRYQRYNFDKLYYVVDNSQSDHFQALFDILKKLGLQKNTKEMVYPVIAHIKFGRVRGMSTRKGTAVFLKDILDEAQSIMKEKLSTSPTTKISANMTNEVADILGTSVVIINDLKQRRQRDYNFDWNHILQVEGDTGIKLQYTHSRLCNLEKNSGVQLPFSCDPSILTEVEVTHLVRELARFEEVLVKSHEELEACHLVNYLFQLCNQINKAVKVLKIKNQEHKLAEQRLLLFHVSRSILAHGMQILGLRPLENM